jgi:26S proteasome regulatory subunit N1
MVQSLLASILSVLAMTYSDTGKRDTLFYRLLSGSTEAPGSWGHEYVRHLASELGEEYNGRFAGFIEDGEKDKEAKAVENGNGTEKKINEREYSVDQLRTLAMELVDFCLQHNAEADAVDLLLELECIGDMVGRVDEKTWPRVCQYMVG